MDTPASLLPLWHERAEFLQQFGDPNAGRLWHLAAAELERALKALDAETLSLVEAASLSGYSAAHLGHLVAAGKIPNAGRKHAPRIRRGDLPVKSPAKPGRPPRPAAERQEDGEQVTSIKKFRRKS